MSVNTGCSWMMKSASFMRQFCEWSTASWRWHLLNRLPGRSLPCSGSEECVPIKRFFFFLTLPLNNNLKSFSGIESSIWQGNPPVDSCEKQRVTVCQNHNKPLLRQSLTGFPSGSCVTSWDNETAAPRPTTCSQFHLIHHTISTANWQKKGCLFINTVLLHG